MKPTHEQQPIIDSTATGLIKVVAYSGTGKTSTLVGYALARCRMRGLYVAFNKSTQLDASRRFPTSVMCKTMHGLAFAKFGRQYSHKLTSDFRASNVIRWLELSYDYEFARLVIDTLKAYLVSAEVTFPKAACAPDKEVMVPAIRSEYAALMASRLWKMMCDPHSEVGMTHDGYLKLYQLSKPVLPFDYIMLDEYQDTNPVTAAIILGQSCTRIMVGDPYQAIYKFRGAKNIVDTLQVDATYYLTQSWRFGPQLAALASRLLKEFFGEKRPLIGMGPDTQITTVEPDKPAAILCRTNAEVFNRAVDAVGKNVSIGFVGGVDSYGFELIHDVYRLSISDMRSIRDVFVKSFDSFAAYELFALESGDREASMMLKVVDLFRDQIPELIDKIRASALPNHKDATRIFSTAHKSKGLEFPHVTLADDFWDLIGDGGPIRKPSELDPEEVRLMYVALTRAINTLTVNSQLAAFMTWFSMRPGMTPLPTDVAVTNETNDFLDDIDFDFDDNTQPLLPEASSTALHQSVIGPPAQSNIETVHSSQVKPQPVKDNLTMPLF